MIATRWTHEPRTLVILASCLTLGSMGCVSDDARQCIQPLDPAGTHYGRTYADWMGDWWRWYFETPASVHPLVDREGENCASNQPDAPVFYLLATGGPPPPPKSCTIPSGRAIFFPVITFSNDNGGVPVPVPDDELPDFVETSLAHVTTLEAELDGCSVRELQTYRTGLDEYSYDCPDGDCVYSLSGSDFSGHVAPAFADGFALLFGPLPRGEHDLHFKGAQNGGTPEDISDDYAFEATYRLTVQ